MAGNTRQVMGTAGMRTGKMKKEFYEYVRSLPDMATSIDSSGAGLSIGYKKPD